MREFEPDDGVLDEFLAEGAALVGVFHGFFIADAREAEALDDDADAFVVEIRHDNYRLEVSIEIRGKRVGKNKPLNPWFSLPIKFSTGTFTSSNVT